MAQTKSWDIWVDTGGTFTDGIGVDPKGRRKRVKVLSSSGLRGTVTEVHSAVEFTIAKEWEAPGDFMKGFEIKLLDTHHQPVMVTGFDSERARITIDSPAAAPSWKGHSFEVSSTEEAPLLAARLLTQTPAHEKLPPLNLRLATTRGTNALLERKGARTAFFITQGFGDLLRIGNQQRPDLFSLHIVKPDPLYEQVVEIPGRMDAEGKIIESLDLSELAADAEAIVNAGIKTAAVVCMNSYANPDHEMEIKNWLVGKGFEYVSVSSELSEFIKILPRSETTLVNACLAPVMENYLSSVQQAVEGSHISVMTSAGGLQPADDFLPKDSLLSGPAAGVVGAAAAGRDAGFDKIISFDMGGTSTDVSRYDGDYEYTFEHRVGNAHLMAPAVAVETVAAGGGSICSFDGHALKVGPGSAGASPGPACYGAGGPLTLTDINVLAGRLDRRNFHIPIDIDAARKALRSVTEQLRERRDDEITGELVIAGFLNIANQRMAGAIEKISLRKGYDAAAYGLVSFGGAGGQHCCGIARQLNMDSVVIPKDAGLLSACGLGRAVMEHFEERQVLRPLDEVRSELEAMVRRLGQEALAELEGQLSLQELHIRRKLIFLRLKGQESTLELLFEPGMGIAEAFEKAYRSRYGHWVEDGQIEVESLRVVASTKPEIRDSGSSMKNGDSVWTVLGEKKVLFEEEWIVAPIFDRSDASSGVKIEGPALILDPYSTVWLEPGWKAKVGDDRSLVLEHDTKSKTRSMKARPEAVSLELFTHRFTSIAEKMGQMLQRTALSVNIKERQDFSCALLNPRGELVVNAPHIPVHLGAMGVCVRALKEHIEMRPGDVVVTNHPAYGGSHLPDVTVVMPVYTDEGELIGYAANRAHHAEIGGMRPGSMPPDATNLGQEGVVIFPMYLVKNGEPRFEKVKSRLSGAPFPTRSVDENMTDLQAQLAAGRKGAEALRSLAGRHGLATVQLYMDKLKQRAAGMTGEMIRQIPNGTYRSKERLDDGTPLCVQIQVDDEAIVIDFEGTGPVHPNNLNATPAIVNSVVIYVLRVLVGKPIPLNEGLMEAVTLKLPECLLNPAFSNDPGECPAVVGGNVEVSQRLTDVLLKPFERIACGQGTMNNVLFGNDSFGYYETVGGGSGAGPDFEGADAVHQHMTNTRGTDPEILEQRYPVRLDRYAIRQGSGGRGKHAGGDGIIREMTFLEPVELSVLTQHREQAPCGLKGGEPGKKGGQWVVRENGEEKKLAPSDSCNLKAGDRFILYTPGGGGFGKKKTNDK